MSNQQKLKLIIADDHPVFCKGLAYLLNETKLFSKITVVHDGGQVLKELGKNHHDIVLMDIRMTPVNGIDATKLVYKQFKNTKVVALTMNDDEESVIQMIQNGSSGYLLKNSDREEIIKAIFTVYEGGNYYSAPICSILAKNAMKRSAKDIDPSIEILSGERFQNILYLMCHELSNQEIAHHLCISPRTVEYYRKRAKELTSSRNNIGVMKYAFQSGLLDNTVLKNKWFRVLETMRLRESG